MSLSPSHAAMCADVERREGRSFTGRLEVASLIAVFCVDGHPDADSVQLTNFDEVDLVMLSEPWDIRSRWMRGIGSLEDQPETGEYLDSALGGLVIAVFQGGIDVALEEELA